MRNVSAKRISVESEKPADGEIGGGANWASKATPSGTVLPSGAPSYWVASAFAAYETKVGGQKTTVQLNANNLFNKIYYYDQMPAGASNSEYVNYGTPRQFKLSAKVEF